MLCRASSARVVRASSARVARASSARVARASSNTRVISGILYRACFTAWGAPSGRESVSTPPGITGRAAPGDHLPRVLRRRVAPGKRPPRGHQPRELYRVGNTERAPQCEHAACVTRAGITGRAAAGGHASPRAPHLPACSTALPASGVLHRAGVTARGPPGDHPPRVLRRRGHRASGRRGHQTARGSLGEQQQAGTPPRGHRTSQRGLPGELHPACSTALPAPGVLHRAGVTARGPPGDHPPRVLRRRVAPGERPARAPTAQGSLGEHCRVGVIGRRHRAGRHSSRHGERGWVLATDALFDDCFVVG